MTLEYSASEKDDGIPLGLVLRTSMQVSDTLVRKTKREKRRLEVNGESAFTNRIVSSGDAILIDLPNYEPLTREKSSDASNIPVQILFEDEYLLAVWKPAFLQTHPSPSAPGGSDTLENRVQKLLNIPVHPVHRLDEETSGIVIFAKYPYIQSVLQEEMQNGKFQKEYHAYVYGIPSIGSGYIEVPILQKSDGDFTRIVDENGKYAKTHYQAESIYSLAEKPVSLLRLAPLTGRTHQLRVHLSYLGCPILGDLRYGSKESINCSQKIGLKRQQLCSDSVSLIHPITGKKLVISSVNDLEMNNIISDKM